MDRKTVNAVMMDMIEYYESDPRRIQHFMKVHSFSKLICENQNLDKSTQLTLEIAALVHDIGIRKAEELYGSSSGKYQEELGPDLAEELLKKYSLDGNMVERIRYLVGHHHSYSDIRGMDYQILVEADFLVNILEDEISETAAAAAFKNIFKTQSGKRICKTMYAIRA